jgi:hypothetical protein
VLPECYEQRVTAPSDLCNFASFTRKLVTPKRGTSVRSAIQNYKGLRLWIFNSRPN